MKAVTSLVGTPGASRSAAWPRRAQIGVPSRPGLPRLDEGEADDAAARPAEERLEGRSARTIGVEVEQAERRQRRVEGGLPGVAGQVGGEIARLHQEHLLALGIVEAVDPLPLQVDLDPLAQARQRRVGEAVVGEQRELARADVDPDEVGEADVAEQARGAADIAAQRRRSASSSMTLRTKPRLTISAGAHGASGAKRVSQPVAVKPPASSARTSSPCPQP